MNPGAVIGPVVNQDFAPTSDRQRRVDSVGIRLRTRHGEADLLHGGEARRELAGRLSLVKVGSPAEGMAMRHSVLNRRLYRRRGEAEEPGGEVPQ